MNKPTDYGRLEILEHQVRRNRRLIGLVLLLVPLTFLLGAAQQPFVDLVCKSLVVKDAGGKTVLELKDSGEVKALGRVTAKGVDILSELESLKATVKSNQDDTGKNLGVINTRLGALEGRYVVETGVVGMGVHGGNSTKRWDHHFPANTLAISGWVSEGGEGGFIGEAAPMTEQVAMAREKDGRLRVRVAFNPRYNNIQLSFHYILVRRP